MLFSKNKFSFIFSFMFIIHIFASSKQLKQNIMKEIKKTLSLTEHQYDVLTTLLKNFVYAYVQNPHPERFYLEVPTYLTSAESASDCINIIEQLDK